VVRERVGEAARGLVEALGRRGVADVSASSLTRSLYASDASLYRVEPLAVARPRHTDELIACVDACREAGVPLTMRGAGTSIAGNAVGPGLVVDTSRHLDAITSVDRAAKTAVVQPGVVHHSLQRQVTPLGLRFGPDPSSHSRCTVGGMIGNDACGSRALAYGRTSDNIVALDCVAADGERLALGKGGAAGSASPRLEQLHDIVDANLATIRTEFGRFGRQNSGYPLERLLPERGFEVAGALVGSEGTLAVVLGATVRLVEDPPHRALAVLGYPTIADAADDAPALAGLGLAACEGLDRRLVDVVAARRGTRAVPDLPDGDAWLMAEAAGTTESEVAATAAKVVAAASTGAFSVVTDPAAQAKLWRIREDGAGLAARALDRPGRAGWEDAAVPPERLGAYLRDFDRLLADHALQGVPYGHFGDGCVHVRIDFPLTDGPRGLVAFRAFLDDAAVLVASYGGSLSGEHGDGRARSGLLAAMYSPAALDLLAQVKRVFDLDGMLNPGVISAPAPPDAHLRLTERRVAGRLGLRLPSDAGDLSAAVHRCTGVGTCVAPHGSSAGVMCPSFAATREEKDSTRGRARVLQDLVGGAVGESGRRPDWRAPEVHEALDLCLACKGCATDCPTGVDMATYKAEVLHQAYDGRIRPRSHYALGGLPRWVSAASRAPRAANALLSLPPVAAIARWAAGIDQRRALPRLAATPLTRWAETHAPAVSTETRGRRAIVWADTFTNYFHPTAGIATWSVLVQAGFDVAVSEPDLCCGLTWLHTGQLDAARKHLARTIRGLYPHASRADSIVALEPSCAAMLRGDAAQLTDDPRLATVASSVVTLAEALTTAPGWRAPDLTGVRVVAQPHCHHASVLGWDADASLLAQSGAEVTRVGGCCGLAGSFGMERGHYDVSRAIAEHDLLPTVQQRGERGQRGQRGQRGSDAVVLADGFSCRLQLEQLGNIRAVHLAELLARSERNRIPQNRDD
jgi:FAD/FMN-containing dehydrogenase/Fe-S oxidoreductase